MCLEGQISVYDQCRGSICDWDLARCLSRDGAPCLTMSGLSEEGQGSVFIWGQSSICDLGWGSLYEGSGLHVFGGLGL